MARYVIINGKKVYGDDNGNGYNNNQPKKKRSGAKYGINVNGNKGQGMLHVIAWNYSKSRGLIKATAFETSKSKRYTAPSTKNDHIMLFFEIFYERTGNKIIEHVSFNKTTGKAYLPTLGMVISCTAPNGGYFGQIKKGNK